MPNLTKHETARAKAVVATGDAVGTSSVTARENASRAQTARDAIIDYVRVLLSDTTANLRDALKLNGKVVSDFGAMKPAAQDAAGAEWLRLYRLFDADPVRNPLPKGTEALASKNGSKGIKQRRRPLENLQEFAEVNLPAARESVSTESKLNWAEKCDLWQTPKAERCLASTLQVVVGVDSFGCVHALGPNYRDDYLVETTTLDDGTEQERCTVSVGPSGAKEDVEVVISTRPSGEIFAQMQRVVVETRQLGANARKFIVDTMDAETYERHQIPTKRADSNG
tara:strand:+ start:493 stop:1338 length:846 start_codon:yes stop_codon:yes gene_type:complete